MIQAQSKTGKASPSAPAAYRSAPSYSPRAPNTHPLEAADGPCLASPDGAAGASGIASSLKRKESDQALDGRASKIPCGQEIGDIIQTASEGLASLLERERQRHAAELRGVQDRHLAELTEAREKSAEEIRRLSRQHAGELEKQGESFERELSQRKSAESEDFLRQKASVEKAYQDKIDILSAKLDTADRTYRTAVQTLESKLADQDTKHREASIRALRTSYEARIEAVTNQLQSEKRAEIAEFVAGYQAREASLKATLAEKDAQISTLKKVSEVCDELARAQESISALPKHVQTAQSNLAAFATQAQNVHNQVQQLQGFMTAMQSNALQQHGRVQVPMYWVPPHHVSHGAQGPLAPPSQRHGPNGGFPGPA